MGVVCCNAAACCAQGKKLLSSGLWLSPDRDKAANMEIRSVMSLAGSSSGSGSGSRNNSRRAAALSAARTAAVTAADAGVTVAAGALDFFLLDWFDRDRNNMWWAIASAWPWQHWHTSA